MSHKPKPQKMTTEKRKFYTKLSAAVVFMFISPMIVHLAEVYLKLSAPVTPFLSLGFVLFFMGIICKLVINRENDKARRERKERKIKNK